jgi:hypothetical protein
MCSVVIFTKVFSKPNLITHMKKILFIAVLFLIPFCGISQTSQTSDSPGVTAKPIDGFLGIKFGSSKAAVTAAIKARGGQLDKLTGNDILAFDDVKFGHRQVRLLIVRFVDDKAYEAAFSFVPSDDNHAIDYYESLVSDLSEVYGKGLDVKKFTSPYEQGDGHETTALLIGAADYKTLWEASANKNLIQATINKISSDLWIHLYYWDDKLSDEATAKQKAKDKSDY